ncbi:MAG: type II toxin-antitoxin system RelE/ParE family toxin [Bosea sp. (in: a-proteobacteria)]
MSRYVLSPKAQADLEDIWDFTVERWGIAQAELYLRRLQTAIELVGRQPQLAQSAETVRAGYFKFAAGSHVLFFRRIPDGIDVVRILHSRMDFTRHV